MISQAQWGRLAAPLDAAADDQGLAISVAGSAPQAMVHCGVSVYGGNAPVRVIIGSGPLPLDVDVLRAVDFNNIPTTSSVVLNLSVLYEMIVPAGSVMALDFRETQPHSETGQNLTVLAFPLRVAGAQPLYLILNAFGVPITRGIDARQSLSLPRY